MPAPLVASRLRQLLATPDSRKGKGSEAKPTCLRPASSCSPPRCCRRVAWMHVGDAVKALFPSFSLTLSHTCIHAYIHTHIPTSFFTIPLCTYSGRTPSPCSPIYSILRVLTYTPPLYLLLGCGPLFFFFLFRKELFPTAARKGTHGSGTWTVVSGRGDAVAEYLFLVLSPAFWYWKLSRGEDKDGQADRETDTEGER